MPTNNENIVAALNEVFRESWEDLVRETVRARIVATIRPEFLNSTEVEDKPKKIVRNLPDWF